jgi:hypothetical protein
MQTGSSGTLIGWKTGQTTFVPLWDRMEGAWLWTQFLTFFTVFHQRSLSKTVLKFLNNLWGLGTASRNRVVVPARQATQPG